MPIPESEAFLKKKPTVPPSFHGITYEDDEGIKKAQDAIIREQWVKLMMARLVREEMGKCYRREGVNHLQNCGHLRGQLALFLQHAFAGSSKLGWRGGNGYTRAMLWTAQANIAPTRREILRAHEALQDQRTPVGDEAPASRGIQVPRRPQLNQHWCCVVDGLSGWIWHGRGYGQLHGQYG